MVSPEPVSPWSLGTISQTAFTQAVFAGAVDPVQFLYAGKR
jgi:hypothetical protein